MAFLDAVSPEMAIVSVGAGNSYGHPAAATLTRLAGAGAAVYRTELNGTITVVTDGNTYTVTAAKGTAQEPQPPTEPPPTGNYIGNRNTKKFHLPSCSYLPDPGNRVYFATRQEAVSAGYSPCGHCRP